MKDKNSELIPPDKKQCQAEKPNGQNFMTLGGGHKMIRCTNKPTWIASENEPDPDGVKGSMAVCDECKTQLVKQLGENFATFTPIIDFSDKVIEFCKDQNYTRTGPITEEEFSQVEFSLYGCFFTKDLTYIRIVEVSNCALLARLKLED